MIEEIRIIDTPLRLTIWQKLWNIVKLGIPFIFLGGTDYASDFGHARLIKQYAPASVKLFSTLRLARIVPKIPLFANIAFDGLLKREYLPGKKAEVLSVYWVCLTPGLVVLCFGLAQFASPAFLRWNNFEDEWVEGVIPELQKITFGLMLEIIYTPVISLLATEGADDNSPLIQLLGINMICSGIGLSVNWRYLNSDKLIADNALAGYGNAVIAEETSKLLLLGACLFGGSIRRVGRQLFRSRLNPQLLLRTGANGSAEIVEFGLYLMCNVIVGTRAGARGEVALTTTHAFEQVSSTLMYFYFALARASGILVAKHHALAFGVNTSLENKRAQLDLARGYNMAGQLWNLPITGITAATVLVFPYQVLNYFSPDADQIDELSAVFAIKVTSELAFSLYRTANCHALALGENIWPSTVINMVGQTIYVCCALKWIEQARTPKEILTGLYSAEALGAGVMAAAKCLFFERTFARRRAMLGTYTVLDEEVDVVGTGGLHRTVASSGL